MTLDFTKMKQMEENSDGNGLRLALTKRTSSIKGSTPSANLRISVYKENCTYFVIKERTDTQALALLGEIFSCMI